MRQITIKENEAGQRLDKFLHKYLKEAPNSFLFKMMRKKNITLNGKKTEGREMLSVGDQVSFYLAEETIEKFRGNIAFVTNQNLEYTKAYKELGNIPIIFENQHILLLNKPSGILTQKANPTDLSLNEWLLGYLLETKQITDEELQTFKPSVCNRLDRNTSGLVVCGKSLIGSQTMSKLLKDRTLHKFYRLYVKGCIEDSLELDGFLYKNEQTNKVSIVKELKEGQSTKEYVPIVTRYTPLYHTDSYTYLEVELVTGKTHQIRAHLASINHPLAGDHKYGDKKWNQMLKSLGIEDQMLHAYRLQFPHMEAPFEEISEAVFLAKEPEIFKKLFSKSSND
ncbi:MAG: RluA family pseudouridine synthase [Eubacteriales bacterium]